ncbi:flagellar hook-length control protein FliK [Viridibacillus sp. YIM B01967]|uniref:Flagellar hook-length control protein FliK n=1 Tax=Viridibacillus soli TaxID=2798301 RepID=A0ABS1H4R3_9BACL|nr:flagellar hook-length control protein FliK [Viridibacillus soli]MBK3494387.1 flagellar hook-length control protein FliK [Viridibacillus soli]
MNIDSVTVVAPNASNQSNSQTASASNANFSEYLSSSKKPTKPEINSSTDNTKQNNVDQSIGEATININRFSIDLSRGLEGLLGQVMNSTKDKEQVPSQAIPLDDMSNILGANSLTDLSKLLNISIDETELSSEGISLEKLAEVLGLNAEDLQAAIEKLTGDDIKAKDVWDLLSGIDQNAFAFMQNLISSLNGDKNATVSQSQASGVLQFLKLVELAAPKTDLVLNQELQVFQVKEWMATVSTKVEQLMTQVTNNQLSLAKSKDAPPLMVNLTDASANENVTSTAAQTKGTANTTVTITLPTNKASQAETFVKEFQAIMNRSQTSSAQGMTKLLIKLYPENLGTIRVELVQKDGVMTARLLASTALGKEMLDSQLHSLKQGLVNQNIQLDRIDITQALSDANRQEKGQHQFNQAFKQQAQDQDDKNKEEQEDTRTFNDYLTEMEV